MAISLLFIARRPRRGSRRLGRKQKRFPRSRIYDSGLGKELENSRARMRKIRMSGRALREKGGANAGYQPVGNFFTTVIVCASTER